MCSAAQTATSFLRIALVGCVGSLADQKRVFDHRGQMLVYCVSIPIRRAEMRLCCIAMQLPQVAVSKFVPDRIHLPTEYLHLDANVCKHLQHNTTLSIVAFQVESLLASPARCMVTAFQLMIAWQEIAKISKRLEPVYIFICVYIICRPCTLSLLCVVCIVSWHDAPEPHVWKTCDTPGCEASPAGSNQHVHGAAEAESRKMSRGAAASDRLFELFCPCQVALSLILARPPCPVFRVSSTVIKHTTGSGLQQAA